MSDNIKTMVYCAIFASVALAIYALESVLPPILPVAGVKLGLANTVTLAAMYIFGRKKAFCILLVRIVLSSIFAGQPVSFLYSFCGGMLCFVASSLLMPLFTDKTMWFLGVAGAVFHNIGQLAVGIFMVGRASILYYGVIMTAAACITGTFTGLCAQFAVLKIKKLLY